MANKFPAPAENRAIELSGERGMDVPLAGSMRPLKPGAVHVPHVSAPHVAMPKPPAFHPPHMSVAAPRIQGLKPPRIGGRKYYGEL